MNINNLNQLLRENEKRLTRLGELKARLSNIYSDSEIGFDNDLIKKTLDEIGILIWQIRTAVSCVNFKLNCHKRLDIPIEDECVRTWLRMSESYEKRVADIEKSAGV